MNDKGFKHHIQQTKARIQAPAPAFTAAAIVNGEITEISLKDYLGKKQFEIKVKLNNNKY